jgi:hypothetical protein
MKKTYLIVVATAISLILSGCGEESSENTEAGFTKTSNTFTANDSNLTWQDNAEVYTTGASTMSEASAICESRTIEDYSDWRLPTKLETFTLYSTHRANLNYNSLNYEEEDYYDVSKLRHLTWTDSLWDTRHIDGKIRYGVTNEYLSTESGKTENTVLFAPIDGAIDEAYSIRCVRDNTEDAN